MLHKISQFCDKIDTIKNMSDELRVTKYGYSKSPERDMKIQNLIETIQSDCLLVANDKGDYEKGNYDYSGVDHDDSMLSYKRKK